MAYKIIIIKKKKANDFKMEFLVLFCFKCIEVVMMVPISIRNIFHQHLNEKADCINIKMKASCIKFQSEMNRYSTYLRIQKLLKCNHDADHVNSKQIFYHWIGL